MKLLIAGSRSIADFDLSEHVSSCVALIISGGARGVDTLAEEYADKHKISKLILRPDYSKYGKYAPLKRNEIMINIADGVLVIWDGKSRGSQFTLQYCRKANKKVTLILGR